MDVQVLARCLCGHNEHRFGVRMMKRGTDQPLLCHHQREASRTHLKLDDEGLSARKILRLLEICGVLAGKHDLDAAHLGELSVRRGGN